MRKFNGPISSATLRNGDTTQSAIFFKGKDPKIPHHHPYSAALVSEGLIEVDDVAATLAGSAGLTGTADGLGPAARFHSPYALAIGPSGTIYVTDRDNYAIRKVSPEGEVTTMELTHNGVPFHFDYELQATPLGICVDENEILYVAAEFTTEPRIWKITPDGVCTIMPGAVQSMLSSKDVAGLCIGPDNTLVVVDGDDHRIISFDRTTGAFGGPGAGNTQAGGADGDSSHARFYFPHCVCSDGQHNLYVGDGQYTVRKLAGSNSTGVWAYDVTTLAGLFQHPGIVDGTGSEARFGNIYGICTDGAGNVYVADSGGAIRKITAEGVVTTLAGLMGAPGSADGHLADSRFNGPCGVVITPDGSLYVADTDNHTIRFLSPD